MTDKAIPDLILYFGITDACRRAGMTAKAVKSAYYRVKGNVDKLYYRMKPAHRHQINQMVFDCYNTGEYTVNHMADLSGIHPEVVIQIIKDKHPNFDAGMWDEIVILHNYLQTKATARVLSRRHRVTSNVASDIIKRYNDSRNNRLVEYGPGVLRIAQIG